MGSPHMTRSHNAWQIGSPVFEADQVCKLNSIWPWGGHRRFAYDLVCFTCPSRVLELGTHWGTSFFSFCQAVKDRSLSTECIAVDTWKGDEHSGQYGEEVFTTVQHIREHFFSTVNVRLMRMFFNEALDHVEDESVDIFHIDGLHTYEAVSADYNSWLPKLKDNGVVLLHDVAEQTGYGSAVFWGELCARYKHFTFPHSWGLGVVFPKGDSLYHLMLENNFPDKLLLYQYQAEAALASRQTADLSRMVEERDLAITGQARLINERWQTMQQMETMILERDRTIASQGDDLEQQRNAMQQLERTIGQRDDALAAADRLVQEKDRAIATQARLLEECRAAVQKLEAVIRERDARLTESVEQLSELATLRGQIRHWWRWISKT